MQICFLDMDGVLVNFVKGALDHHNFHIPDGQVKWDFNQALGLSPAQFWAPFGREFWANLEWTSEGKELLAALEERFEHIVILTSPCHTAGCCEGKLDWITQHIPKYKRKFLIGPVKHLCASPKHILIDDHDINIDNFIAHGGHGALVPRSWNRDFNKTTDNIFLLSEFLRTLDMRRADVLSPDR